MQALKQGQKFINVSGGKRYLTTATFCDCCEGLCQINALHVVSDPSGVLKNLPVLNEELPELWPNDGQFAGDYDYVCDYCAAKLEIEA
jgi:hypothetical protein